MTDPNPITPPPELAEQWKHAWLTTNTPGTDLKNFVATQAARWGADQELEACCEWLEENCGRWELAEGLSAARRPQPQPSLKEQALAELAAWTEQRNGPADEHMLCDGLSVGLIRRALELVPDGPQSLPVTELRQGDRLMLNADGVSSGILRQEPPQALAAEAP